MYCRCFKVQEQLADFIAACGVETTEEDPVLVALQGVDVEIVEQVQNSFRRRWEMLHIRFKLQPMPLLQSFFRRTWWSTLKLWLVFTPC
jgi:hypothetical protein